MASATLSDLTTEFFAGDVFFRVDDACFDAAWGWVPLLGDFAIPLHDIPQQIQDGEIQTITFLENAESLSFKRDGQFIEITATYTDASARVCLEELRSTSRSFMHRILSDLSERWPDLALNPIFIRISEIAYGADSLLIEPALIEYW
jgi:hypothetical protein